MNKDKKQLAGALQAARYTASQRLSGPNRTAALAECDSSARARMAPLVLPETRARGERNEVIVPSEDPLKCKVWGIMWAGDESTLAAIHSLGFKTIECKDKTWDVDKLARTCFLYDPEKPAGVVFVWKTLDFYKTEKRMGSERGTDAAFAYMGLVSRGANTMRPGGTYSITRFGNGWVSIEGVGDQKGIAGFVDRRLCQRKPLGK
jgi:hypothetical protein